MSSSPLHQDEYDWDYESNDPRTGGQIANPDDFTWDVPEFGNETREKMDDGRIKVQQSRGITGTFTGETDDDFLEPAQLIDQELKKLNLSIDFFRTPKPGEVLSF